MEEVAAELDPDRPVQAILDSLSADGPAADQALESAAALMVGLRDWVAESGVVPLPDGDLPAVRPAPAWDADADIATLEPIGGLDRGPAFLDLVVPVEGWSEERTRQHLARLATPYLLSAVAHAAYPGRYVQRLYEARVESELRRTFTPRAFEDGWAHYAEQLVQEAGFRGSDPALRLGQLRRALVRHARWYAALHLHAFDTPVEDVVERFQELTFLEEIPAQREVVRASYDPVYLADALGRLQIVELRRDYSTYLAEQGDTLSLPRFHEELLSLALPLPVAREVLIPERGRAQAETRRR
jgi:hypothetical protein